MRILSVADRIDQELLDPVGGAPAIGGIDLVLSCGDLPPEYLTALRGRYQVPLLYVMGNHDIRYGRTSPRGCLHIHRRFYQLGETKIIGFSGSRWYNGNENQFTEEQMAGFVRKMRFQLWRQKGVDLILTHAPPRHIGDAEDRCHRGFRCFRLLIDKYRPRYFLHGHIHRLFNDDSERITVVNSTSVVNSYGHLVLEI